MVTKSFRFPEELAKKIEGIAKKEKRSLNNWLVCLLDELVTEDSPTPQKIVDAKETGVGEMTAKRSELQKYIAELESLPANLTWVGKQNKQNLESKIKTLKKELGDS